MSSKIISSTLFLDSTHRNRQDDNYPSNYTITVTNNPIATSVYKSYDPYSNAMPSATGIGMNLYNTNTYEIHIPANNKDLNLVIPLPGPNLWNPITGYYTDYYFTSLNPYGYQSKYIPSPKVTSYNNDLTNNIVTITLEKTKPYELTKLGLVAGFTGSMPFLNNGIQNQFITSNDMTTILLSGYNNPQSIGGDGYPFIYISIDGGQFYNAYKLPISSDPAVTAINISDCSMSQSYGLYMLIGCENIGSSPIFSGYNILISNNIGQTFMTKKVGNSGVVTCVAISQNGQYMLVKENSINNPWISSNFGITWNLVPGIITNPITKIFIDPLSVYGYVLFDDYGNTYYYDSFFAPTIYVYNNLPTGTHVTGLVGWCDYGGVIPYQNSIISTLNGKIYKATDTFATWNMIYNTNINKPIQTIFSSSNYIVDNSNIPIIFSNYQYIYTSLDSGASWNITNNYNNYIIAGCELKNINNPQSVTFLKLQIPSPYQKFIDVFYTNIYDYSLIIPFSSGQGNILSFFLSQSPPLGFFSVLDISTKNILYINTAQFKYTNVVDVYTGNYILYEDSGILKFNYVVKFNTNDNSIILKQSLPFDPINPFQVFAVAQFSSDNYNSLLYPQITKQSIPKYYIVELLWINLPNELLITGGTVTTSPYIIISLTNKTINNYSYTYTNNLNIYKNNSNFIIPSNIFNKYQTFLNYTKGMKTYLWFNPGDTIELKILLSNGKLVKLLESEPIPSYNPPYLIFPTAPMRLKQISVIFKLREI